MEYRRRVLQASVTEPGVSRASILVQTDDEVRVQRLLAGHAAVRSAARSPAGVRVTLRPDVDTVIEQMAADIELHLRQAGIAVHRLEITRASLAEPPPLPPSP